MKMKEVGPCRGKNLLHGQRPRKGLTSVPPEATKQDHARLAQGMVSYQPCGPSGLFRGRGFAEQYHVGL